MQGNASASTDGVVTAEANARLEQLESSVANLLAGLAGGSAAGGAYPNGEVLHTFDPAEQRHSFSSSDARIATQHDGTSWPPILPTPTHLRPIDPPRFRPNPLQPSLSPEDSARSQVRFASSPGTANPFGHMTSPSNCTSSGAGISPTSAGLGKGGGEKKGETRRIGKGQKAEERLAAATEGAFEPPFKALVYQVRKASTFELASLIHDSPTSGIIESSHAGTRLALPRVGMSCQPGLTRVALAGRRMIR